MRKLKLIRESIRKDKDTRKRSSFFFLIDVKMRKSHLTWFVHAQRKVINAPMRKRDLIQVKGTKRGILKPKIWQDVTNALSID